MLVGCIGVIDPNGATGISCPFEDGEEGGLHFCDEGGGLSMADEEDVPEGDMVGDDGGDSVARGGGTLMRISGVG